MTRQQVAKRLGRSVATVRRLEGNRLHARQDARGVHYFDPDEVEALARDIDQGEITLWQELGPTSGARATHNVARDCERCTYLEEQIRTLRGQLDDQRATHLRELDDLRADHYREARELAETLAEVMASLDA